MPTQQLQRSAIAQKAKGMFLDTQNVPRLALTMYAPYDMNFLSGYQSHCENESLAHHAFEAVALPKRSQTSPSTPQLIVRTLLQPNCSALASFISQEGRGGLGTDAAVSPVTP